MIFCSCAAAAAGKGEEQARSASSAAKPGAVQLAQSESKVPLPGPSAAAGEDAAADAHSSKLTDTELGRAIAAMDREPKKAVDKLEDLEKTLPWIDDVLRYHAAVAKARYDASGARKDFEDFLEKHPESILYGDATAALARVIEASGDEDDSIAFAQRYGTGAGDTPHAAAVCLATGRLLVPKDPARAYPYLQCARQKSPLSGSARKAYELVTVLRTKHPELRPSGSQALLAEAKLLGRENRGAEQVTLLREILAKHPESSDGETELMFGRVLGRQESKAAGADYFERRAAGASGARRAKLLYEAATFRWNDNRNAEAEKLFEQMLALKTGSGDEQEALYALGRINDGEGQREKAIAYFGRAAALQRGAKRAESQWRQGWVSYRAKDYAKAERAFATMAANAPRGSDTDGRPEALYWQGRSLEKLGRKEEAHECFVTVLSEFPLGYYAAAAEKRLGRRGPRTSVKKPVPPGVLPPAASLAIQRAQTLREAGLVTLAARDLAERLERFDPATRRAVLPALPASGAYDAAFRIASEMHEKNQITREEARAYFYPKAYGDIVEREAKQAGIDPTLVYALMRQESAFATTAISSAKAMGLMQLLESTAKRVAAANGLPSPDPEDLFDPATNIRLGVRYLAELSKLFDGSIVLMAAAYNAGETAAARWKDLRAKFDEDEMIEQISYRETRLYVKSVLRNMRNYRNIYG